MVAVGNVSPLESRLFAYSAYKLVFGGCRYRPLPVDRLFAWSALQALLGGFYEGFEKGLGRGGEASPSCSRLFAWSAEDGG